MPDSEIAAAKERTRRVWGIGDYRRIARLLEPAAAALVDACAVSAGQEVVDVAAGSGNFAALAAREGASVTALDLSPDQVALGRARCEEEGLSVEWIEGDAEDLPFDDESFDCVGSVFGAVLTPQPDVVSRELFRVVRPGGTVGFTAWPKDGFQDRLFSLVASYSPVQDNLPRHTDVWGSEELIRSRIEPLASSLTVERGVLNWGGESPEAVFDSETSAAGPGAALRQALPEERWSELRSEAVALIRETASPADGGGIAVQGEYLVAVARKRG